MCQFLDLHCNLNQLINFLSNIAVHRSFKHCSLTCHDHGIILIYTLYNAPCSFAFLVICIRSFLRYTTVITPRFELLNLPIYTRNTTGLVTEADSRICLAVYVFTCIYYNTNRRTNRYSFIVLLGL